jgi:hypothetical protein
MEEKKQGGKRRGAGRKPVQNKKVQISLYVEGGKIFKFGNEEKMKTYLYSVIDEFGQMGKLPEKIDYSKAPILLYDAPKINRITNDETALWQEPKPKIDQYAAYQTEISTANSVLEIENIVREIKKDTIPDWQKNKLEKIAIEKSKTFDF